MSRVAGKVAIVSGAANGIGKATAQLLAKEGAKVVIGDLKEEDGQKAVAEIKEAGGEATFVKLNVTDEAAWKAAIEQTLKLYGRLDIAVNNAGIAYSGTAESTSLEDWRIMILEARCSQRCGIGFLFYVPVNGIKTKHL